MTSRILFSSPLGMVAFTPDELAEALNQAKELVPAVRSDDGPSPTTPSGERWLTVSQTSGLMNLPRSFLYEGLKSGDVPGRKFGRFWRIPVSYTHQNELVIRGSPAVSKGNL